MSAYLDGELSPAEKTLFLSHLDACRDCSRSVSGWESVRAGFFRAPSDGLSPFFWARFDASVGGRAEAGFEFRRWLVPAGAFTFATVFVWALLALSPAEFFHPLDSLIIGHAEETGALEPSLISGVRAGDPASILGIIEEESA